MNIWVALADARKERFVLISVIGVLGYKRRAHDIMVDANNRRDRDISRSDMLTSWIVRLTGKHPPEERVFSTAMVDELAETWFLHGEDLSIVWPRG